MPSETHISDLLQKKLLSDGVSLILDSFLPNNKSFLARTNYFICK